ncbi:unnamed protein product [Durusdinium trenchii]|uniref:Uncharacterized protein n=1 Tax=Durusdinium trenchii TaxID=1381693 RepID=A0ABP0NXY7_9DINO
MPDVLAALALAKVSPMAPVAADAISKAVDHNFHIYEEQQNALFNNAKDAIIAARSAILHNGASDASSAHAQTFVPRALPQPHVPQTVQQTHVHQVVPQPQVAQLEHQFQEAPQSEVPQAEPQPQVSQAEPQSQGAHAEPSQVLQAEPQSQMPQVAQGSVGEGFWALTGAWMEFTNRSFNCFKDRRSA